MDSRTAVRLGVLFWSALAAAAASLLATALYGGGADNQVALWWVAETIVLGVLLSSVAARLPAYRALFAGAAVLVAMAASPLRLWLRLDPPSPPVELALLILLWTAAALVATAIGLHLRAQAHRRARAVKEARHAQRTALARDLHDFVAHDVSGIVVFAQAALHTGETEPAQAMAALRRIERAGLAALSTLDKTVHALRTDVPAPGGIDEVSALVDSFGHPATAAIDPALTELPPAPATAAHRVVAEALTNIRTHAPDATRVHVAVARDGPNLLVEIANDLPARRRLRAREHGGTGIAGLAELVTALGGTFRAGPDDTGGWLLSARIPCDGTDPA